jgi:hypothetical protein
MDIHEEDIRLGDTNHKEARYHSSLNPTPSQATSS